MKKYYILKNKTHNKRRILILEKLIDSIKNSKLTISLKLYIVMITNRSM